MNSLQRQIVNAFLKAVQASSRKSLFLFALTILAAASFTSTSLAQTCPSPAVAADSACTVPSGTTITVTTANTNGENASGPLGMITSNGVTINLGAAGTTGALAQSGSAINFNGSTLQTTATTTATTATQIGLRAVGVASAINATGSSVTMGPPSGTVTANDMIGAIAQGGGTLSLTNTPITMLSGGNGNRNHGLVATGAGSVANFSGASITTQSRGSYGVLAQDSGRVALGTGTSVTTTGAQIVAPGLGSHALLAIGSGSFIEGDDIFLSTSGLLASGARAEDGGHISLVGSTISTSSTASSDFDPSSAARALSGGLLEVSGSSITATGQRGHGLSAEGIGSRATVSDTTISASGTRANGVFVSGRGQADISDSTITSLSSAVSVQDTGSSINLTDTAIRATGAIGYGLRVVAGAATMTGGSSTTEGRDAPGMYAASGSIVANNVVISTSGPDNAMGVLADFNGQITLNGGSVTTSGDAVRQASFPHALGARNPGGLLTSTGTTILTTGITSMGAVADDGGSVFLTGISITTLGVRSIGLYSITEQVGAQFPANLTASDVTVDTSGEFAHGAAAQARNDVPVEKATLTVNGSAITTHGAGAVGLRATLGDYGTRPISGRGEAAVIANRSTVSTEGIGAHGALSRDNPTSVTMNDTAVLATGAAAHGSVAQAGGLIVGNNASVTATGANASALFLVGEGGPVSTAIFTDSLLRNASAPTVGVAGAGNATLTGSVAGGSGEWLRVGTIDDFPLLGAAQPPIRGIPDPLDPDAPLPSPPAAFPVPAAPAATPGLANILLDGSTVTGSASTAPGSVSNVIMRNNSVWNLTGNSNLTYLLNDPSLIDFSPPVGDPTLLSSYKTLTVVNYVGEDGQIAFNTYLGADGSPSDRLIIDGGTATGSTGVIVRNTTGPGALTVADGILVVDTINGATSDPAAFNLLGDYVTRQGQQAVVGGAFAYTLNYGGVGANATDNNWYLRSVLEPTPPGPTPPGPDPDPPVPLYQAGVPLYEVYAQNLLALGGVPTMQQRVGNRYWQQPAPVEEIFCKDPAQNFKCRVSSEQASYYADGSQVVFDDNGIWTRIEGSHFNIEPVESTSGTDYDTDLWKLQAGFDGLLYEAQDGGRLIGGITVHYGQANSDVTSIYGEGTIDTDGYGFGGTLTWLAQNGFYVDGQASLTWFSSDLDSDTANRSLTDGNDGFGYALSVETGKKIDVSESWTVTPQAQLVYANVDFDDFTDVFGADVSLGQGESLRGRIGISADRDQTWQDESGKTKRSHVYGIANLYYEFLGETDVDVSDTRFETRPERFWGGVGVGGSYNWNDDKYSVYGELSANTSLEGFGDSYALNGTAGFRVKW